MTLLLALVLLHGTVRIGPTSPVCQADQPCTKPAAHVVLTFRRGAAHLRATTDVYGRYRVKLAPGAWSVRASTGMAIRPAAFWVPRAVSAKRNFTIDTGIR
jgi:hypothetical protein